MFYFHHKHGCGRGRCGPRGLERAFAAAWAGNFESDFGPDFESGFGPGQGRGGRRGGGGRRGRMVSSSELKLLLLHLINEEPRHGYDLIRAIEERTGGVYAPSPGIVYPTLSLLEEMGHIAPAQSDGSKKSFAITESGVALLAEEAEDIAALIERLETLGDKQSRPGRAPVGRAMGNLAAVLMHRIGDRDLDADALHDIAAIIDEAARKIERG